MITKTTPGGLVTRPDKEILSEVLEKTIKMDMLVNARIRDYFDLEVKFDDNNNVLNQTKIEKFGKFFFMGLGANKKLNILKEIMGEQVARIENFQKKFLRIYEIRDIFAHHPIPKKTSQKWLADFEKITWEELYEEHKELCKEIIPVLGSLSK